MIKLLCLSNGHGEDAIARRILHQLQQLPQPPELAVLPLVGEGLAYSQLANVPIIGPVKSMPSGGFIYMDGKQFWRDLNSGLLQLTCGQFKVIKNWAKTGGVILAVGDILPLLLAWLSGAKYAFVATAKSEYWLEYHGKNLGKPKSVFFPWERWLMSRSRCQAVFVRDTLTAYNLKKFGIAALDLGNPMMDDLGQHKSLPVFQEMKLEDREIQKSLVILLLPGSRSPEAYANWEIICQALDEIVTSFADQKILCLGAIAPHLSLEPLCETLENHRWRQEGPAPRRRLSSILREPVNNLATIQEERLWQLSQLPVKFTQRKTTIILTQNRFNDCLHEADIAIAMAGTATEQFVGLGKPAIAIPGQGPQYSPQFAEMQSRLLGISLILVKHPSEVAPEIQKLLNNPDQLKLIAQNGKHRMGKPGASQRIAHHLAEVF